MTRVAILGGGAAGISAARSLQAAGHEARIFEARDRLGGRAYTDYELAAHPVEMGAEFIHGDAVSAAATWEWVREFTAPTTGEAHRYEIWSQLEGKLVDGTTLQEAFGTEPLSSLFQLTKSWLEAGGEDVSLAQILDTTWDDHFSPPLNDERRHLIANMIAELAATDIEELGAYQQKESAYEGDAPDLMKEDFAHWRLLNGYTQLMQQAAIGLSVSLSDPVSRVRWDDEAAEVVSASGSSRWDRVVVTLPLGVLRSRSVEFLPELPEEKLRAIEGLNTGHINKVVLKLDRVYWPPDLTFLWTPQSTQLWWRPGQGQEDEEPLLSAYTGGSDAASFETWDQESMIEEATRQLGDILGESLGGHVLGGRFLAWGTEDYTRMAYSSAPVGASGLRASLAAPVGSLRFAGEATNVLHPSSVNGAIESGARAAAEID